MKCPSCQQDVDARLLESGVCPACGHRLTAVTETTDVSSSSGAPSQSNDDATARVDQTLEHPSAAGSRPAGPTHQPRPGLTINYRKLSRQELIERTTSWEEGSDAPTHPHGSIKSQSHGSVGLSSRLVIKPRELRLASRPASAPPAGPADYELENAIGKGGMGVVFEARQASVDRTVAVKMLRTNIAADLGNREKFMSEAVVTGDLEHPNIVPIYEMGTDDHGALFYSMKRVHGTPWSDVIRTRPLAENLEILMKVADAVAFAHANGVVHRDLKPANIMLGDYGEVLVMDWGLAKVTSGFRHPEFVTPESSHGGTPAYMAPEMAAQSFVDIGPASDVYLLGALLYELLTGRAPHTGKTRKECLANAAANVIQPSEQKGELIDIARRAMSSYPEDRYPSVRHFQAAIRDYHSHTESVLLAERAEEGLAAAASRDDYEGFARALFGFQEAADLWSDNQTARAGVSRAKLAYARRALEKEDFELGLSLLDAADADHAALRVALGAGLAERAARQKRLTWFKRASLALLGLVLVGGSVALVLIIKAKNEADRNAKDANIQKGIATANAKQAQDNEAQAVQNAARAEREAKRANLNFDEAEKNRLVAEKNAAEARTAEEKARQQEGIAKDKAAEATEQREKAVAARDAEERAAYLSRVSAAAAKIDENSFDAARTLLENCKPEHRSWEWGRLWYLCNQGQPLSLAVPENSVAGVAFAPGAGPLGLLVVGEAKVNGLARIDAQRKLQVRPLPDADRRLTAVEFSARGNEFYAGREDGAIELRDSASGRVLQTLAVPHKQAVTCLALGPRGSRLVSGSADGAVMIRDAASGQPVSLEVWQRPWSLWAGSATGSSSDDRATRTAGKLTDRLLGHVDQVTGLATSPSGKWLVTVGLDRRAVVWEIGERTASGRLPVWKQGEFLAHEGPLFAVAFSPHDERKVATAGYDRRVLLWNPAEARPVNLPARVERLSSVEQAYLPLVGHTAPIRALRFSPDGRSLASGGDDNALRIWDVGSGRSITTLRRHARPIKSCAFSADGQRVASGGDDRQVLVWSLADYQEVRVLQRRTLSGHAGAVTAAAFDPANQKGDRVITASGDRTARVWELGPRPRMTELREGHELLLSRGVFFAGGRRLLTAAGDNSARLWDLADGVELHAFRGTGYNAAAAVSGDGRWIVTGDAAGSIKLWKAGAGPDEWTASVPPQLEELQEEADRAPVSAVAISPDQRWIYFGNQAGVGRVWDLEKNVCRPLSDRAGRRFHARRINEALFRPRADRLLVASADNSVSQWDTATWRPIDGGLLQHDCAVDAMVLSRDGKTLVTAAVRQVYLSDVNDQTVSRSTIRRWNLESGAAAEIAQIEGRAAGLALTADEASVFLGVAGRGIYRLNLTGEAQPIKATDGPLLPAPTVAGLALAPDGKSLVTLGMNQARLWDLGSRRPVMALSPQEALLAAGFSRDGKRAVTAGLDGSVKIWDTASGRAARLIPAIENVAATAASFSPRAADLVVSAGTDGVARLWRVGPRAIQALRTFPPQPTGKESPLRVAAFSRDGSQLVTGDERGQARLWNVDTGALAQTIDAGSPIASAAFSPDGERLLLGCDDTRARLYRLAAAEAPTRLLSGHTGAVGAVAFSADGQRAVTGARDQLIKVWHIADEPASQPAAGPAPAPELLTLRGHDRAVTAVSFSPDGLKLLSASSDGTAVLWPAETWK